MKWITQIALGIFVSLCLPEGHAEASPVSLLSKDIRPRSEAKTHLLGKTGQGKTVEAYKALERESSSEEPEVNRFKFLGRNVSMLIESMGSTGDKANALVEHGPIKLKTWLGTRGNNLGKAEKMKARGLMAHMNECDFKDERQTIPSCEPAVKQVAPEGWKFDGVEDGNNALSAFNSPKTNGLSLRPGQLLPARGQVYEMQFNGARDALQTHFFFTGCRTIYVNFTPR